jgi:hypothetical protein
MKLTYSDIISRCQDGANDTSSTIKTFFKQRINERYELIADKLNTFTQTLYKTSATVEDQQYYYNPPNLRDIVSITIAIGDVTYTLDPINSQSEWDRLNAIEFQGGAIPTKFFRRRDDYGIFPIPQEDDYTITIAYTQRAVPLYFEDYTTGTVTVTENDQTVTVATGNLTTGAVKAGFWFSLADANGEPRGNWYRIDSVTDANNMELETYFEETAESGASYIIGQCPEIPEEGHPLLSEGALEDFFMLKRQDSDTSTKYGNRFWTGSPNISPSFAKTHDGNYGGLLGLIAAYADRDDSVIVNRNPSPYASEDDKVWATTISDS